MAIYRNKRFLFDDPLDKSAINRTTRYQLKRKWRQGQIAAEESESPPSLSSHDQDIQSYEDEDLGSCGDSISLSVDDPQSDDDCASFFNDGGANDCYCVQDDGYALMQYPELEYEFEAQPQDLSDDELDSLNDEQSQNTSAAEVLGSTIVDGSDLLETQKYWNMLYSTSGIRSSCRCVRLINDYYVHA